MEKLSVYDAKAHFSELIERAVVVVQRPRGILERARKVCHALDAQTLGRNLGDTDEH